MADLTAELNELFGSPAAELSPDVLGELQSLLRLHSISPQELFYKWESYSIKMGPDTTLNLKTARDLKKDIQDTLERENRAKAAHAKVDKKTAGPGPRAGANTADVFGMLDGLVPNTPGGARSNLNGNSKRKSTYETPASKAAKTHAASSPLTPSAKLQNSAPLMSFADRPHAGETMETLNAHIPLPEPPAESPAEPRIKLKANTEIPKFAYKTMAMKLSEASEILDDRIDEFLQIVQEHHKLEDSAFGNPASQSPSEIIAVGRIASDSSEGRLNAASLVLETSRRTGAGLRVPLRVDNLPDYSLFPGKIVAIRGSNASGSFFQATELLEIPILPSSGTTACELDVHNARLSTTSDMDIDDGDSASIRPVSILSASGPFTPGHVLDYSALHALVETASTTRPDVLILSGPFLDIEHPSVINGDFSLPASAIPNPDEATVKDVLRHYISAPLVRLAQEHPTITMILQPSVRDAISKHVSFPQDRFKKPEFGLPRQAQIVTNPVMLSINEITFGISSLDVLDMLRREECAGDKARNTNAMVRWASSLISQRSFCPVFPPTAREVMPTIDADREGEVEGEGAEIEYVPLGACLDTSFLKLAEWLNVKPDVLVTPSALMPFAKVINSVLVLNPGTLSKRKGPGTYSRMTVLPAKITDEEREKQEPVAHKVYERARVDIVHI
ncbi:DNA polymerase alpha subunit B N-terminal-domain-containing protein [Phyllosticta citrichinensis]|uniref:DNA polymerase alpha subunit B n=1 Tax=Phyllosticta citrichinensis TaxID=1130410 RepID=A0ABR1XJG6_9PEZI